MLCRVFAAALFLASAAAAGPRSDAPAPPEILKALYPAFDLATGRAPDFQVSWSQARPSRAAGVSIVLAARRKPEGAPKPFGPDGALSEVELAVVATSSSGARVLARREGWFGLDGGLPAQDQDHDAVVGLDLAPYRIAPGEYAIGVLTEERNIGTHGDSTEREVELFRVVGSELRPALKVPVLEHMYGEAVAYGASGGEDSVSRTEEGFDRSSVLIMKASKTDGFFDILVRTKDAAHPGRPTSRLFRWSGDGYLQRAASPD
jgi:hypothetical protein